MRRSLTALLAIALLAGATAARAAEPYVDQANGFQLTPPNGWTLEPVTDDAERKLRINSADDVARCNVTVLPMPTLAKTPQAELDASFRRGDADGVVKEEIASLGLKESDFSQSMIQHDGHPAVYATFALTRDDETVRVRKLFMASPGRSYNLNCTIYAASEEGYAADLDALYASLRLSYP